jgi:hypothetical protein
MQHKAITRKEWVFGHQSQLEVVFKGGRFEESRRRP